MQATDDSDHLPLMTTLDLGAINFVALDHKKAEDQPPSARFTLPMKKEELLMYQSKLHVDLGQRSYALTGGLRAALESSMGSQAVKRQPSRSQPTTPCMLNAFRRQKMMASMLEYRRLPKHWKVSGRWPWRQQGKHVTKANLSHARDISVGETREN